MQFILYNYYRENYRRRIITPRCACARAGLYVKQSFVSIYIYIYMPQNDKTASNTLNTYLYCFKSLPRTVHQILHLPSSLRSKNSLHGLRWGGFWIATPLPATQLRPGMISHAQLASELLRAAHARSRG